MNSSVQWKILLLLISSAFCLVSCSQRFMAGVGRNSIYESVSPAKLGSVLFFEDTGFQDTVMTMYVRDNAVSRRAIQIGSFDEGQRPLDAVWSRDGTVIAVREQVRLSTSNNRQTACGVMFTYVYDFRKHVTATSLIKWKQGETIYTTGHLTFSGKPSCQKARQLSNTIKALLKSRGGEGQKVLANWDNFDEMSRPVKATDNLR